SGMPASGACPKPRSEVYIAGTEPVGVCPLHGGRGGTTTVSGWDTSPPPLTTPSQPTRNSAPVVTGSGTDGQVSEPAARRAARQTAAQPPANPPAPPKDEPKKETKGVLQRLLRVFK
ncbi:MAG: penicillin-binding protein 1A, partial [Candidatus Solibacter sp.]